MKLNDICPCLARVYRTLNRPLIRSKTDMDCEIYSCDMADRPTITLNIKGAPEVKLLDLILIITAMKVLFTFVGAILRLFKD